MASNVAPKIILDGLILHLDAANVKSYPGSGTLWSDLTTNKFDGTLTNGPIFTSDNLGGIVFDGVDDYVEQGVVDLTSGTDITVDIFMKLDGIQYPYADIIDYNHSSPIGGFVIQQYYGSNNEDFYFAWWNGSSFDFAFFSLPIDNTYFHLAITKNGGNVTVYINSVPLYTGSGSASFDGTGRDMRIGANAGPYGRYVKGTLPSLRIYDRALTSNEVLQNYNALKTRFGL
jgi:Concanavalin A-like lectin/glucanases superfamily